MCCADSGRIRRVAGRCSGTVSAAGVHDVGFARRCQMGPDLCFFGRLDQLDPDRRAPLTIFFPVQIYRAPGVTTAAAASLLGLPVALRTGPGRRHGPEMLGCRQGRQELQWPGRGWVAEALQDEVARDCDRLRGSCWACWACGRWLVVVGTVGWVGDALKVLSCI